MAFNEELFQHNLDYLCRSNPGLLCGKDYDIANARKKRDLSSGDAELDRWLSGAQQRVVTLPRFLPRSPELYELWQDNLKQASESEFLPETYVDLHDDLHLKKVLSKVIDAIIDADCDPQDDVSTINSNIPQLIAFGTGSGEMLQKLINTCQPFHLVVAVTNWDDFISSFWHINWPKLWKSFVDKSHKKLTLVRVHSEDELLSVAAKYSLLCLEHSYLYVSSAIDSDLSEYSKVLSGQKVQNLVHYLGYTIDEYNMVYNTVSTLRKEPKVFAAPALPTKASFIVCGSGPSLDNELATIEKLSATHVIIAGGSNYRTLRIAGIDPEYLVLVERSHDTFDDYRSCIEEMGRSSTKLVMSSTCHHELIGLFDETATFFRPILTPLSIFSDNPSEILNYEGPESVNTAAALAIALGAEKVILFGVDLGTSDISKDRSGSAAGYSTRKWDIEDVGNYGNIIYTNRSQLDVKLMLEAAIKSCESTTQFINCSAGLLINGAEPQKSSNYVDSIEKAYALTAEYKKNVDVWWGQLQRYSLERLQSSWRARNPRETTFRLSRQLQELFDGSLPWFPQVLKSLDELLRLDVPLKQQFPRRIMRSTVLKASLAVTQQMHIMFKHPMEKQILFGGKARSILSSLVSQMENEIYALCDLMES